MHLFFDLDNTLWDFDTNSGSVLSNLYAEYDLAKKLNTDFESFYKVYHKINDELWHLYYFKKIEKAELRYKRFYDAFLFFGYDDIIMSKAMAEDYVKHSPYTKALKPGCIETLEQLGTQHELHIITNGFFEVQNIKIDNCGLRNYFSQIIISEEYGLNKPHVEIFRLAETLAGTNAKESVMIGDNLVSDIEGAIGAGWRAIYYNCYGTNFKHETAESIGHLNELIPLFVK